MLLYSYTFRNHKATVNNASFYRKKCPKYRKRTSRLSEAILPSFYPTSLLKLLARRQPQNNKARRLVVPPFALVFNSFFALFMFVPDTSIPTTKLSASRQVAGA